MTAETHRSGGSKGTLVKSSGSGYAPGRYQCANRLTSDMRTMVSHFRRSMSIIIRSKSILRQTDICLLSRRKLCKNVSGARRASIDERIAMAVKVVEEEPTEQWLIWCNLNAEQDEIARQLKGNCVSIFGSLDPDRKVELLNRWLAGEVRYLVSKASMFGYGLNLQNSARQLFVGVNDSWEQFYQAVRRSWRFGQTRDVHVHIIAASTEG